jgi:uncharacterized protein YbjT (DUF2867 family)
LILVSGATGQQGGAVVRSLLGSGIGVRVLTRDPEKPEAREIAGLGAEVASGDPADRSSIERVLDGVHGVFSERLGECRVYSGRLACRQMSGAYG